MKQYYFFNVFRKTLIQFFDAFNDIKIARYTPDGKSIEKYVEVPIKHAIKEKVYYWLNERKDDQMLPMITAHVSSIDFGTERVANSKFEICAGSDTSSGTYQWTPHPCPYNLTVTMNIWTLHMVDMDQIIEQILPFFCPHIFIRVRIDEVDIEFDVKVVFTSGTPEVSLEMADDNYRVLNYQLQFRVETWFFQPVETTKLAKKIYGNYYQDQGLFIESVNSNSTFTSGASGAVLSETKGKIQDGELIVTYHLFEPEG